MDPITLLGMLAACCTTLSFVPQAIKTIRTKDTASISLMMYTLFTLGTFAWAAYGFATNSIPVILANVITSALALVILIYKIRYK